MKALRTFSAPEPPPVDLQEERSRVGVIRLLQLVLVWSGSACRSTAHQKLINASTLRLALLRTRCGLSGQFRV